MGEWDEYCTVCGGPPWVVSDNMVDEEGKPLTTLPLNPADYTWLESFLGLSNKGELIPLASYGSYGRFDIPPDTSSYTFFRIGCRNDDEHTKKAAKGYACHVTCYNLLQQELNYTLKFGDVLPLLVDNEYNSNHFSWSDYGGLAEYQEQYFNELQLVRDGKLWMIEDPIRNGENKERILQVWRPLVESGFKRPDGRSGVGSKAPEMAEMNLGESRASWDGSRIQGLVFEVPWCGASVRNSESN